MTKQDSVPMNDLKRLYRRHQVELEREVTNTLRSGWWLNGMMGRKFATNFARFIGVSECVLVANGTDALELALAAVAKRNGQRGREVLVVANAGGYASCACWHNDLIPHYVDIEPASQLMDLQSALKAANADTAAAHSNCGRLRTSTRSKDRRQCGGVAGRYFHIQLLPDQESRGHG
ncbi:hypothetical protein EN746_27625 [Mesorhizobium sp. M8A.F.Ca.ET.023.02.2.1]|nr:hypothetical protein EN746_27625 [Mesorhizobium sp. M8A.F.Ca.ET.023.02.2.1]